MMSKAVCDKEVCSGCSACQAICPQKAINMVYELQFTEAEIDEDLCVNCNLCKKVCPNHNKPVLYQSIKWYQGWSKDPKLRKYSSSGGVAQVLSRKFIFSGGYVCSCLFDKGEFVFRLTASIDELEQFRGSKYVKSNPGECYKSILNVLKETDKGILFIGLPCQVAAVKNFVGLQYAERLYTVDLICHGTPSAKLLAKFFTDHDQDIKELKEISFRKKGNLAIAGKQLIETPGVMDEYSIAFLEGVCYTENCYSCQFAREERVSDITLGDSWGTELSEELSKGVSLILCQTDKGVKLINDCSLELYPVDLEKAIAANPQLRNPCKRPYFLNSFYTDLRKGLLLKSAVSKYCRKKYIKQQIKKVLIKLHLLKLLNG